VKLAYLDHVSELTSRVLDWVETSGRALELRVARTWKQVGQAEVQPAFNYQDTVTGLARESDVVAKCPWTGMDDVPCTITVAVECKSSTKHPWVAFYADDADDPGRGPSDLQNWAVFAHGPFVGITEPLAGRWTGQEPFATSSVASHVAAAFTNEGRNPADEAVRQALSCAAAIRSDYINSQSTRRVGLVILAAVVTAAPLLACRLNSDGEVQLRRVDEFDVCGYGQDGNPHRVYVRSEKSLPSFAAALRDRAAQAGS
jgi:hypothetical protein